jgi:DNA-binding MarR family transcriptional regulator
MPAAADTGREARAVGLALDVLPGMVRLLQQAAAGDGEGLTLTQIRLLKHIAGGCALTSELAERLEVTPATVSGAIDALVRRGLVERLPSGGDRRAVPLRVTSDGHAALDAGRARQEAALAELLAGLRPRERWGLALGLRGVQRAIEDRRAR